MSRGMLTEAIQSIANEHIGRDITTRELRLIPYVQFALINDHELELSGRYRKVNDEEIKILERWVKEGRLESYQPTVICGKKFWDFMSEVIWEAYACVQPISKGEPDDR